MYYILIRMMSTDYYMHLMRGPMGGDSIDTHIKKLNRLGNQYSRSNGACSLARAMKLYEIVWKLQIEMRGEQDPRSLNAYMNVYRIEDRVNKAKIGRKNSQMLNKKKQKLAELNNAEKNQMFKK